MPDVCKKLQNAIKDENKAQVFYDRLKKVVSRDVRWKIDKIKSQELIHSNVLKGIYTKYKCDNVLNK